MTGAKWWLRVVGTLYLLEGVGLTLEALFASDRFASLWASAPADSLDEVAIRGMLIAGLPGVLTWVLLGAMMWIFSRAPQRAGLLILTVTCWELLVWLPTDLAASFHGFTLARTLINSAIHIAIGGTGLWMFRRMRR